MRNSKEQEVIDFICNETGSVKGEVTLDSGLYYDLGIYGEDAHEILEAYSNKFQVSLDQFKFESYFEEEVPSNPIKTLLYFIFKPILPGHMKQDKKNITVKDLVEATDTKSLIL